MLPKIGEKNMWGYDLLLIPSIGLFYLFSAQVSFFNNLSRNIIKIILAGICMLMIASLVAAGGADQFYALRICEWTMVSAAVSLGFITLFEAENSNFLRHLLAQIDEVFE